MGFRDSLNSLAADNVTSGRFTGAYQLPGTLDVGGPFGAAPMLELGTHSDATHGLRLYGANGAVLVDLSADNGSASFAGTLNGAGGTFSGTVSAGTITGGSITGTNIQAGELQGTAYGNYAPALLIPGYTGVVGLVQWIFTTMNWNGVNSQSETITLPYGGANVFPNQMLIAISQVYSGYICQLGTDPLSASQVLIAAQSRYNETPYGQSSAIMTLMIGY